MLKIFLGTVHWTHIQVIPKKVPKLIFDLVAEIGGLIDESLSRIIVFSAI